MIRVNIECGQRFWRWRSWFPPRNRYGPIGRRWCSNRQFFRRLVRGFAVGPVMVTWRTNLWHMELVRDAFGGEPTIEMTFDSPEEWLTWLSDHEPDLLRRHSFRKDTDDFHQRGTGSYWSTLRKVV